MTNLGILNDLIAAAAKNIYNGGNEETEHDNFCDNSGLPFDEASEMFTESINDAIDQYVEYLEYLAEMEDY